MATWGTEESGHCRLQNSPYFCVFKYARAVKQKVWNEAENGERDWGEGECEARALCTRKTPTARFTDFEKEKKTDGFAVYGHCRKVETRMKVWTVHQKNMSIVVVRRPLVEVRLYLTL